MKMKNAKVKTKSGGYERLFDNEALGLLFSKAQSTVISNGSELERIILSQTNNIKDLNTFIDQVTEGNIENGVFVCNKPILKKSKYYLPAHQPDLLIFIVAKKRICKIVELKDGDAFDTKKASGEYESLKVFCNHLGTKIPFVVEFYICCFNQLDKQTIIKGFKGRFTENEIMTGKELCEILNLDYEKIKEIRKMDAKDNVNFLLDELLKQEPIKKLLIEKLKE